MKQRSLPAAVLALSALGFTLGTCEFVIVGILPDIAGGLGVPLSAVGRLVSVFAACYAIGTPLLTAATGRVGRYRLLMGLMLLFLAVNVLSMLAPGVAVLYISRVLAALVSGTLTAVAMLFAKEVSPPEQTAGAIAAVYAGFSVPIGTAVCHLLGWRAAFGVIILMGAVLLAVLARLLPGEVDAPAAEGSFLRQFAVLRDGRCWHCVLMVLFSASATYTVYTYLTPTLTETLALPESAVSPVLLVMGLCSAASNVLSGRLAEQGGLKRLPVFFAAQAALFAALPFLLAWRLTGLAGLFAMGLLMYLLNTPVQVHALRLAEADYPAAASLCASVQPVSYNFGIAIGSFTGSIVQEHGDFRMLGFPAAVFALLALWQNRAVLRAAAGGIRRQQTV